MQVLVNNKTASASEIVSGSPRAFEIAFCSLHLYYCKWYSYHRLLLRCMIIVGLFLWGKGLLARFRYSLITADLIISSGSDLSLYAM